MRTSVKQDVAKVALGAEAFHAVANTLLWRDGISLTFAGLRVTPAWSLQAALINALVAVALAFYAWSARSRPRTTSDAQRV